MKILSQVLKELKISSRGFYFYVDIVVAFIILLIMLFLVPEEVVSSNEEYLFYNMKPELSNMIIDKAIEDGVMKKIEDKSFTLKPEVISLYPDRDYKPNDFEGIVYPLYDELEDLKYDVLDDGAFVFTFEDEKEVTGTGYEIYENDGGRLDKKVYLFDSFEDVLRLSKSERRVGGIIYYDGEGRENYEMFFPGIVTEKYKNATYALHNDNIYDVVDEVSNRNVRYLGEIEKLNNRQSFVPLLIIYLNIFMSMFVVSAYIFNDKMEGVIKALRVSPISMSEFLVSKLIASIPVSIFTSLMITIPIMGFEANYPMLLLLIICTSFFGGSLGVLVSSLFEDISSSFGLITFFLVIFMLPVKLVLFVIRLFN